MSFSVKCGSTIFFSSDALYIVHCACVIFPLFGLYVIPIILSNFHVKIRHTKENSTHKRTFHVWMYLYPNICMDTAGITRDSCMTSVKNNIFRLLSPIMRRKENSDCQSTCTIIHCTFNIHIKVTKVNKYTYKRRNSSTFSVGIDPSNIRFV